MMGAWTDAGAMLRGLRQSRGWSLGRLAIVLENQAKRAGRPVPSRESLVRMLRMWEAGAHRPRDYYELFILAYATEAELASRIAAAGSDLDRLMTALELMGLPMDRRKFLLNSAALAVGAAMEPTRNSLLDLFDDDPLPHAAGRLRYLESVSHAGEPAKRVHRLLLRLSAEIDALATRFSGSGVEAGLHAVQAQTLSMAGHTAFYDLGQHEDAERHFRSGMEAAKQSRDSRLRAKLCVNLAHRLACDMTGDRRTNLHDGSWLLDRGVQYAERNPFVLTEIHDMRTFIFASLGSKFAMKEAMSDAAMMMESAKLDERPEWLPGVTAAHVHETAGCSYLRLGEARLAADELSQALSASSSDSLHRSLVLAWAAQASAALREPEHAVSLLQEAIPPVAASNSMLRAQEIRTARVALQPWANERLVRELDTQLEGAGLT